MLEYKKKDKYHNPKINGKHLKKSYLYVSSIKYLNGFQLYYILTFINILLPFWGKASANSISYFRRKKVN